jgi:hypothetical protein
MNEPIRPTFLRSSVLAADNGTPEDQISPVAREIERVADRLGFVNRDPVPTVRAKKRKTVEDPQCSFTMRAAVADVDRFVQWTEQRGLSYRQGFAHLMRLLERAPDEPVQR